jgi:hypothetical protein
MTRKKKKKNIPFILLIGEFFFKKKIVKGSFVRTKLVLSEWWYELMIRKKYTY